MEEKFLFMYQLHMNPEQTMTMPIIERQWLIERYIKQKTKENEAIEAAKKKAK